MIKQILKTILSPTIKRKLKRLKRKTINSFSHSKKTSLTDLKEVLIGEIGITKGDILFVTSSFSQLNAKDYSPEDVINLLQEIVTDEGIIMMPYYPPVNSMEWVKGGNVFDMRQTKSGMGILTNVFAKMEGVVMSEHPFKAVCIWGKDAKKMAMGHYQEEDPYGDNTPYGRLLKSGKSKSICLGVKNLPMFHAIEDKLLSLDKLFYDEKKYEVPLKLMNGKIVNCKSLVHSPQKSAKTMMGGEFVERFGEPIHKKVKFGYGYLYLTDNSMLEEACKREFMKSNTRLKK